MEKENDIQKQIDKLEKEIQASDFWGDKNKAQSILKELAELKNKKAGANKYDKGSAIITIISGAGGDDAEDFGAMLLSMYMKYANKKGWKISFIHEHKNKKKEKKLFKKKKKKKKIVKKNFFFGGWGKRGLWAFKKVGGGVLVGGFL